MKNVAIIVQYLRGGGAERVAANLSIQLSKFYNVHLIVFDGSDIAYPYAGTLHNLNTKAEKSMFKKARNFLKRVREARNIKRREHIDASISLMDSANLVNVLSHSGDKIITSVRNNMSETFKGRGRRALERLIIGYTSKKSQYLVALSEDVRDDLTRNFHASERKTVTIYNPCDAEAIRRNAENAGLDLPIPALSVCTMGRLTEQKGQWHLIRAFTEVVTEYPEAKLYILGAGELESRLKKLRDELKLTENVIFTGFLKAPHSLVKRTTAFVFPSLFEGLGNVLLEAMALGRPCISADCFSGPREILAPGTKVRHELDSVEFGEYGILVSAGDCRHFNSSDSLTDDEKQLAQGILSLFKNEELRQKYAQAALNRACDFSPERIFNDWRRIIES